LGRAFPAPNTPSPSQWWRGRILAISCPSDFKFRAKNNLRDDQTLNPIDVSPQPSKVKPLGQLHPLTRLDGALAVICFFVSLALYIRTLAPGVLAGDSVEFETLASTLGMTHPPGYPIYLLIAKLFTFLPVGNIAYRVNLLSAVFAALALALLYLDGRLLAGWRLAALAAVYALGINGLFWLHAVIAELYTGAAVLVAAEVLLLLLWRQKDRGSYLFVAGLLGGLSLGIHSTVALMAPAVIVYLLLTARRRQAWLSALGGAALGVALYVAGFLLLDAINAPSSYYTSVVRPSLSVWGLTAADFNNPLKRMLFQLEARQFRSLMFNQPLATTWANAKRYFSASWFWDIFVGLGLAALFVRRWREGVLLTLAWGAMLIFIFNYAIFDIVVFYIPTMVFWFLTAACGLGVLWEGMVWLVRRAPADWIKKGASLAVNLAGLCLLAGLLWPVPTYAQKAIRNGLIFQSGLPDTQVNPQRAIAGKMIDGLEDNAIVFTKWMNLYLDYYVAHVERGRTGITFIQYDPQSQAGVTDAAESLLAFINSNLDQRPMYITEYWPALHGHFKLVEQPGMVKLYKIERLTNP